MSNNKNTGPAVANRSGSSGNAANDNVQEFGIAVKLSVEPEEVVWKEEPNEKKLKAVIRFSSENTRKIIAQAEKIKSPESVMLSTEDWYPAELITQSEMSGSDSLKAKLYAADDFYQEPYLNGKLYHIDDTDYFVLELFSK